MNARPITKVELEWMANRLVYLATPYTRTKIGYNGAAEEAARIAARLAQATHGAVFSPIVHGHALCRAGNLDPVKDSIAWDALNARMLDEAEVLVVAHMEGWEESAGVAQEVAAFVVARKPIFDLKGSDLIKRQPAPPSRDRVDDIPHEMIERERQQFLEQRHT